MINIMKQSGKETTYVTEFVVDLLEDISNLPISPAVSPGSVAIVLENSSVYMLGNDNTWKEL